MSNNPYVAYYREQAGSGIQGFEGVRLQRGHGFFGRLQRALFPLLRFLGKQALNTAVNIGTDVIENKTNWRDSAKSRFKETGRNIMTAGLKRARKFQQTGEGTRRYKRRRTTKTIKRKIVKRRGSTRRRTTQGRRRRSKRTTKSALEKLMENY